MSETELAAGAGVLLSLAFSYIPGLSTKFAALAPEKKRLIMLGLLALVAGGSFGLACAGLLSSLAGAAATCDRAGALGLVRTFVLAAVFNQGAYLISPQTQAVALIKALNK